MENFEIKGVNSIISNYVLNEFLASQETDPTARKQLKKLLKLLNEYGIPSHKAPEFLQKLNEITGEEGATNDR